MINVTTIISNTSSRLFRRSLHKDAITAGFFPATQFGRSKDGDRYFFTHTDQAGSITELARTILINRTLAGIICDNTEIAAVPSNVFLITSPNDFISCTDTPKLGDIFSLVYPIFPN